MRPRTVDEVATAVGGSVSGSREAVIGGVGIDSRTIGRGDLFVAIAGERADGHAYVQDAFARGAAAALVARDRRPMRTAAREPVISVTDPVAALMVLAGVERATMSATVVGITGSSGKTCTKDLTAGVLSRRMRTAWSPASFNNEIGLPLTLLSAGEETEAVVCEMGARGAGHIRRLCSVARPTVGVVTNVGLAHLGLFGSPEAIRDAKAELPEALPPEGAAVLNADDPVVRSFAGRTPARVVWFGRTGDAEVVAADVVLDGRSGRARFRLRMPAGDASVVLPVPGAHMVPNALAAAAVGHALGLSVEDVAAGLERARISSGRMELFETADGLRVIDDAYNANPASMAAALKTVRAMATSSGGRAIAVLGAMAELGAAGDQEHERVGELVAGLGIDLLVTVGVDAAPIAQGAELAGLEPDRNTRCANADDAGDVLRRAARPGDLVLVKASRVVGLDRLAAELRGSDGGDRDHPAPISKAASR